MPTVPVERIQFSFEPSYAAEKYDDWEHYRANVAVLGKAVDIVAIPQLETPAQVWLIEVKDFRVITQPPRSSNLTGLATTVFEKARDTIRGLRDAAENAAIPRERSHSVRAIAAGETRIVLHLEPHTGPHSKLFPADFAAKVLAKLRQVSRQIDRSPIVVSAGAMARTQLPWGVTLLPVDE